MSAVVNMVMNSNPTDDSNQQQMEKGVRRMLFQPEPEQDVNGAPIGAPAPKVVQNQPVVSNVSC